VVGIGFKEEGGKIELLPYNCATQRCLTGVTEADNKIIIEESGVEKFYSLYLLP
jgi:hypothetical protein